MLTLESDVNTNMMLVLKEPAKMEPLVSIMEDQIMNAFVHLDMKEMPTKYAHQLENVSYSIADT